ECYRILDQHVGSIFELTKSLSPLRIVLSDHGFGKSKGTIYPNHLLRELGVFHLEQQQGGGIKGWFKRSNSTAVRTVYRFARDLRNSLQKRKALKRYKNWADMATDTVAGEKKAVDWSRTKAAFAGGSEVGFIYINVKGRGRLGCVEPGKEYEALVSELIRRFTALTDRSGNKLFTHVARGSEAYPPPTESVTLPDIVLVPKDGFTTAGGLLEPVLLE